MGKYIKLYTEQPDSNLELPHVGYYQKVFYQSNIVPIEYLQSSGTQYIQLSLPVQKTDYLEAVFEATGIYTQTTNDTIFDTYPHAQFWMDAYSYNSTTNSITFASNVGGNATNGGILIPTDRKKKCILSTLGRTKDDEFTELIRPLTKDISDFRLFGNYYNQSTSYPIKFHNFRIKKNDTIMYDLIPVRVGTTGYMFDKISRQLFGNNGTGNFILGSDIVSDKPYDSEIEYLASDSSAYINTGVSGANNNLIISGEFIYDTHVNYGAIYGNYVSDSNNGTRLILSETSGNIIKNLNTICTTTGNTTAGCTINTKHSFISDYDSISIDGVTTTTTNKTTGTANSNQICMFNRNLTSPTIRDIGLKIYNFKIKRNNFVLRDFIPVRIGQIGYMYDKITEQLFPSVGSGNFILGPDI